MLPIKPEGPNLTAAQAKTLDDEFFAARPLAYFAARITALLDASDAAGTPRAGTHDSFLAALGLPKTTTELLDHTESDRELQVAIDALAVRHHVAEALVRLLHATATANATSIWAAIADGPSTLHIATDALAKELREDQTLFSRAFVPEETPASAELEGAFDIAWKWVLHAIRLLTDNELTVNAAHNKLKHGLAVRARSDVRIELLPGIGPDEIGNIPVSAFQDGRSIPLFDRPMLTYLARPFAKPRQGLELTSLRIEVPIVLAETWMMAVVYGAVFHVAARRHFGERTEEIAPYPPLHTGPSPEQVNGGRVRGYRGVVTLPPDKTTEPRQSGVFFADSFLPMTIDFDNIIHGTVVDG